MNNKLLRIIIALFLSSLLWISISLSSLYYTKISVPVRLINLPSGYAVTPESPKYVNISMKGEGWRLIMMSLNSDLEFSVSAGLDSGYKSINLQYALNENNWLSSDIQVFNIEPEIMKFHVEAISRKKVKVKPWTKLSYKPNYRLVAPVTVSPDSVIVYGPQSILRKLNYIPTEYIEIHDMDERKVINTGLKYNEGLVYSNSDYKMNLDVQRIVDKEFRDVPVTIANVPSSREILLYPSKVSFVLRGGIETLRHLEAKDFHPYIDYYYIIKDTLGQVEPVLKIPEYTTLIKKEPERFKYIIKQY